MNTSPLATFLRERRSRISPSMYGLPVRQRRRGAGLGRAELAELLEVTPEWYALFESAAPGHRFSSAFVHRLSSVLLLDAADHATLMGLVVEGGRAASDLENEWQWRRLLSLVARAARRLGSAASFTEVVDHAIDALRELLATERAVITADKNADSGTRIRVYDVESPEVRRVMEIPVSRGCESALIRVESRSAFSPAVIAAAEMIALDLTQLPMAA